ncbi:MAG: hypothetical protein Q8933_12030 [Bacteroidota bacterium]|nr:hypothetical protein [Bacteroidota bacterium]MDP4195921.1 hypothetical protein [Bacteroidota bacterium]
MKLYKKIITATVLFFLLILIEGCSSSVLVDKWKDASFQESALKKILVIAIRKNPVQRRLWEDAFVNQLSDCDVEATASYTLFPGTMPDTSQIIQSIQTNSFDGILVTRLLKSETETHQVESSVSTEFVSRYNPFRKAYTSYFEDVRHPAYVDSQTISRRSIEVWVLRKNERLIWGATSNTPERNSLQAVQNDIAELVIPELVKNAIINPKKLGNGTKSK